LPKRALPPALRAASVAQQQPREATISISDSDLRAMVRLHGLERALELFPGEVRAAAEKARPLPALPDPTAEPAHVYRARSQERGT
jgi:hypothetical protein